MGDLETTTVVLLVLAALVGGLIDSIAGGGGLIVVPSLVLAGLTPLETLSTNKAQAVFGTGTSSTTYARAGLVDRRRVVPWALASGGASAVGALVASSLPEDALEVFIPVALVVIAVFFAVRRDLGDEDRAARWSPVLLGVSLIPAIGFYDGVFGPGTGSFFMIALVGLAGLGVLRATAHTKVLNFASNVGALLVFAFTGEVLWALGIAMGVGQVLGASIGSRLAIRRGVGLIRPLLVAACIAVALRELFG